MAYMNQEKKAKIAANLKPILKKFGLKGSLSVHNHTSITLNIKSGSIDFYNDFGNSDDAKQFGIQVNPYWFKDHFVGVSKQALSEIIPAMYSANYYDNSDIQSDYFDTAYYIHVNIGRWNKSYELTK
jgi:hypothetical protein